MGGVFSGEPKAVPVVDPQIAINAAAEEERKKALERQRRGREGTIRTSENGILDTKEMDFKRKKLLGE